MTHNGSGVNPNSPLHGRYGIASVMMATISVDIQRRRPGRLRKNDWRPRYSPESAELLEGKTCVLLGYGEIGRRIGAVLSALGMKTIAVRRNPAREGEVGPSDLKNVLPEADVLMITVPLTPETEGLIGARERCHSPSV